MCLYFFSNFKTGALNGHQKTDREINGEDAQWMIDRGYLKVDDR